MPDWSGTYTPQPGDIIALRRGVEWRMTDTWTVEADTSSATSSTPIVFTAYGTGDLPRVTVLKDLKDATWTSVGNGIYYRSVPAGVQVDRVYFNEVGLGEASFTPLTSAPIGTPNGVGQPSTITVKVVPSPNPNSRAIGQTYVTNIVKSWRQVTISGSPRLYLHSPSGNPNSLTGTDVEGLMSNILYAVRIVDKSHVYLDRIDFSGGTKAVVYLEATATAAPTNVRVTNCRIRCTKMQGIRVWSSARTAVSATGFSNGQIKWNRVDSGDGPNTRPTENDVDYGGDQFPYPDESLMGESDGISMYNGVQGWVIAQNEVSNFWHTNISIHRVYQLDQNSQDINEAVVTTSNHLVEHNYVHAENVNYSHAIEMSSFPPWEANNVRVTDNIVRKNRIENVSAGASLRGQNTKFYGNLIIGIWGSPRRPNVNQAWAATGYTVWGDDTPGGAVIQGGLSAYNTYVNCGGSALVMNNISISGAGNGAVPTNYVVANNIMAYNGLKWVGTTNLPYNQFYDKDPSNSVIDVDNNLMYSPGNSGPGDHTLVYRGAGSSPLTVAGMESSESAAGWTGNLFADPQFVTTWAGYDSIAAPVGYQLQSTSPARGAADIQRVASLIPEDISGWTDLGCWQGSSGADSTAFVAGQTLSSGSYNDFSGWQGMRITVGSSPIQVTELGRWMLPGNTQNHGLSIVSTTGTVVASTTVPMSGSAGEFKYAPLPGPVTLAANTSYYIASQESVGGDLFYGWGTILTPTSVATVDGAVRSSNGTTFAYQPTTPTANRTYGPVDFRYYVEEDFVTGQTLSSSTWNDFNGWQGMQISVGSSPIIVTKLGRWILAGNNQTHNVKIVDGSGATLGTVAVATSGATAGQMKYVALSSPVVLAPNTLYYIVSQETNGGDLWYGWGSTLNHTSAAVIAGPVRSTDGATGAAFALTNTNADRCYGPLGFKYY